MISKPELEGRFTVQELIGIFPIFSGQCFLHVGNDLTVQLIPGLLKRFALSRQVQVYAEGLPKLAISFTIASEN
jgi:hypothetical protein